MDTQHGMPSEGEEGGSGGWEKREGVERGRGGRGDEDGR